MPGPENKEQQRFKGEGAYAMMNDIVVYRTILLQMT
jgi:hypothetical protein